MPSCATVRAGTATFAGTYDDAALTAIDKQCACFLFMLHDPDDCELGAIMYLSQFGTYDPMQLLQVLCLGLAGWAYWRARTAAHRRSDSSASAAGWSGRNASLSPACSIISHAAAMNTVLETMQV